MLKIIDFVGAFVVCLNVKRNQLINVIYLCVRGLLCSFGAYAHMHCS